MSTGARRGEGPGQAASDPATSDPSAFDPSAFEQAASGEAASGAAAPGEADAGRSTPGETGAVPSAPARSTPERRIPGQAGPPPAERLGRAAPGPAARGPAAGPPSERIGPERAGPERSERAGSEHAGSKRAGAGPGTATRTDRLRRAPRLPEPGDAASAQARLLNAVIRPALKWVWAASPDSPRSLAAVRRVVDAASRRPVPRQVRIERVRTDAVRGEWVRAGRVAEGRAFLYLHGGGYFFGSRRMYRPLTWRLAAATERPVLAIDYRLMPEHTLDDARADAVAAYEALLAQGYAAEDLVIGGDSAGGHLTLVTLMALRDAGLPLPRAAVVLSPWADLSGAPPSRWINRRRDALIPAAKLAWLGAYYAEGRDPRDPMLSPVHGDYTGLPPLLVIYSGSEILADDARRVAERARDCGVDVTVRRWDGVVHAFPVFADILPEGRAALRHIARFLAE